MATIAEVLEQVGDDPQRAEEALVAELAGANRSTLIAQLEDIINQEAPVSDPEATEPVEAEEVPAPEPPAEVELFAEDSGTVIGPVHVRDADVEAPDAIAADPEAEEPEAIDGEQVESIQGVGGTNAFALALNGQVYLFNAQMVGALKQAVDQAVAGMTF